MKLCKKVFRALLLCITIGVFTTACSSDDSSNEENDNGTVSSSCPTTPTDQVAQGSFRDETFTAQGGTYRVLSGGDGGYLCKIFVQTPIFTNGCVFPDFDSDTADTILFEVSSLEAQTIDVVDDFSIANDSETKNTVNFNRIDANLTTAELSCGAVIVNGLNDNDQLTGSIVVAGVEGSTIDGNFVLDFCDPAVF